MYIHILGEGLSAGRPLSPLRPLRGEVRRGARGSSLQTSILSRTQRPQDRLLDCLDILEQLCIGEADDAVAVRLKISGPLAVMCQFLLGRMCFDFDDELALAADEIGKIDSDQLLPNEFEPVEVSIAQAL